MGPDGSRAAAGRKAAACIHENGVTYNVYGDPRSTDRPWQLDPIPLVIEPREWAAIEAGDAPAGHAAQRDAGRSLRAAAPAARRTVPAGAGLSSSGFSARRAAIVPVPDGIYLHLYAADLARSPDGRWWVIADRTQAPSGAGYALENRMVVAARAPRRVPRLPRARLADFFQAYRDMLRGLVPAASRQSAHRAAHPRAIQRDLFRARLPGALPRLHAGRGRRPDGARQPRVPEDARRAAAGRRDPPPAGRQLLRSARSCARIRCWACRAWCRRCARATSPSPTRSAPGLLESAAPPRFLPGLCRHLLGEDLKMPSVAHLVVRRRAAACVRG